MTAIANAVKTIKSAILKSASFIFIRLLFSIGIQEL